MTFEILNLKAYCYVLTKQSTNSPDYNPHENFCEIVEQQVDELQPQSIEVLIQISFDKQGNIIDLEIQKLISSIPEELRDARCGI